MIINIFENWINPDHIILLNKATYLGGTITQLRLTEGSVIVISAAPSQVAAEINKKIKEWRDE